MNRLIYALTLGLTAVSMSQFAAAQSVTLEPGLYDYSNIFSTGDLVLATDESEYCIKDGENSKTLDELVASLAGDGNCTVSNVSMTDSTGRANLVCTGTDLGVDIAGTLDAKFGSDFYDVDTRAKLGPLDVLVKTKVRRRGDCPAD